MPLALRGASPGTPGWLPWPSWWHPLALLLRHPFFQLGHREANGAVATATVEGGTASASTDGQPQGEATVPEASATGTGATGDAPAVDSAGADDQAQKDDPQLVARAKHEMELALTRAADLHNNA